MYFSDAAAPRISDFVSERGKVFWRMVGESGVGWGPFWGEWEGSGVGSGVGSGEVFLDLMLDRWYHARGGDHMSLLEC